MEFNTPNKFEASQTSYNNFCNNNNTTEESFEIVSEIKFSFPDMLQIYNQLIQINTEVSELINTLNKKSTEAESQMMGKYKKAYCEKTKDIFKDLRDTNKDMLDLANMINKISVNLKDIDMNLLKFGENGGL